MANEQEQNQEPETYRPYQNPLSATKEYVKRKYFPDKISGAKTVLNALTREKRTRTLDDIVSHYGHGILDTLSGIQKIRQERKPTSNSTGGIQKIRQERKSTSNSTDSSSPKDIGSGQSSGAMNQNAQVQRKALPAPQKKLPAPEQSKSSSLETKALPAPSAIKALPAPQKKLPAPSATKPLSVANSSAGIKDIGSGSTSANISSNINKIARKSLPAPSVGKMISK